ncbi:MAG: signal peptidase I [Eubacterium sp.]|nr:signal peptidase I [Eubacterium sp.]
MKCEKCKSKNNKEENGKFICEDCGAEFEIKKNSPLKETLDFLLPIIIALIVAMLLKTFVFANAVVPTGSMLNTIQEGDRVIASRIEYNWSDPERYDIIIFKAPDEVAKGNEKEFYVKRIIGLPGETITIVNGVVYIADANGNTQQARDEFITACTPTGNFGPYVVPEDSYFVMGDNRESSIDSRYWLTTNYVKRDLIIGKVKFRYYPFNTFGKLDNFE